MFWSLVWWGAERDGGAGFSEEDGKGVYAGHHPLWGARVSQPEKTAAPGAAVFQRRCLPGLKGGGVEPRLTVCPGLVCDVRLFAVKRRSVLKFRTLGGGAGHPLTLLGAGLDIFGQKEAKGWCVSQATNG